MRLLIALLVLGFLQLASGWYSRDCCNTNVPRAVPRHVGYRYENSSYIWGQRENGERIMLTVRVAHSDYDVRQYMNGKSITTKMRYSFIGKVTVDATLPQDKQEFECPISYIEVQSHIRTGGYVAIISGGIRHRFVILHFESTINCSLDFSVRIFGTCCEIPRPC